MWVDVSTWIEAREEAVLPRDHGIEAKQNPHYHKVASKQYNRTDDGELIARTCKKCGRHFSSRSRYLTCSQCRYKVNQAEHGDKRRASDRAYRARKKEMELRARQEA